MQPESRDGESNEKEETGGEKRGSQGKKEGGATSVFVMALPALHHWDASALMTSPGWEGAGPGDDVINNQSEYLGAGTVWPAPEAEIV